MSIRWHDCIFEGPFPIQYWNPPNCAALYAIMVKPDASKSPRSYRILYFGKANNLSDKNFYLKHDKLKCWTNFSGSEENLFIAFYDVTKASAEDRVHTLMGLIDKYRPVCNF
ncbi:MAG: hypothetical protein JW755_03505 [Candidatus Aminicenantes bacterium]|nr:hypothetical protein [Candidatus Aminicenantes bacterium]